MARTPKPPRPAWVGSALGAIGRDDSLMVAAFPRDDRSEIRVTLRLGADGDVVADLRVFEGFAGPAKARRPGETGMTFREEEIADLSKALAKVRKALRGIRPEDAWLDDEIEF